MCQGNSNVASQNETSLNARERSFEPTVAWISFCSILATLSFVPILTPASCAIRTRKSRLFGCSMAPINFLAASRDSTSASFSAISLAACIEARSASKSLSSLYAEMKPSFPFPSNRSPSSWSLMARRLSAMTSNSLSTVRLLVLGIIYPPIVCQRILLSGPPIPP